MVIDQLAVKSGEHTYLMAEEVLATELVHLVAIG
jgi:hypothetical protein